MGGMSRFGLECGRPLGQMSRQRIRYVRTSDGVRLAWAEAGQGPTLVKATNWLTHLEYEWESPVWRHWIRFLSDHFRFVRYDERGCGMTDWNVRDLSAERQLSDLEAVVDAAGCREPFTLLGISQGGAQCLRYINGILNACRVWCSMARTRRAGPDATTRRARANMVQSPS